MSYLKAPAFRAIFAVAATILLTASQCSPPKDATPKAWYVSKTRFNSNTPDSKPGDARTGVFFSALPAWQEQYPNRSNFAPGWMNDLIVKNPYAFQVEVQGGDFLNGGLTVRNADTQAELKVVQAHVNHGENCGPLPADPTLPQVHDASIQCFPHQGDPGFVSRPLPPSGESVYSIELVSTCNDKPIYTDLRCVNGKTDAILILTISPPTTPNAPMPGQKFNYTLVNKVNGLEATTPLTAAFVKPGQCAVDDLQAVPIKGSVGDQVDVQWYIRNCHSLTISASDTTSPLFTRSLPVDTALEADMSGSRKHQLTDNALTVKFTAAAYDAMGVVAAGKIKEVSVEPCSIRPTHPQCESRCKVTPPPAGCPHPPAPVCPVGEGDANRQKKDFSVNLFCYYGPNWGENKTITESACTEADAQSQARSEFGPSCTVVTGPGGSQDCPNGASKKDWSFCLACANPNPFPTNGGPDLHDETVNACYLPDAVNKAQLNYPNQNCWLQNAGKCPQ